MYLYLNMSLIFMLGQLTCATKGVNMAPTRAQAEASPIPSVLMVVGYTWNIWEISLSDFIVISHPFGPVFVIMAFKIKIY